MHSFHRTAVSAALALVFVAACKKEAPAPAPTAPAAAPAPAAISGLVVGKAVGADKMVTAASDNLGGRDTIYASVTTTGVGTGVKVKALWTMGNETVRADSLVLDLTGPATTEFHIMRGAGRSWPAGSYTVAVSLNDGAPMTHNFVVR